MEPFRFVHAARLMLDHQLHGTGPLPENVRLLVRDATIKAWDRVVETCLSEQVDMLLLTGGMIDPVDRSLRGPAALIRGLERLSDREIPVVVAAGIKDPWSEWPEGFRFPANVVRLGVDVADELPLTRDGRVLAHLQVEHASPPEEPADAPWLLKWPTSREIPVGVRVSPVLPRGSDAARDGARPPGYRGIGGGTVPRTIVDGGVFVHDPGPTQAIGPLETGPRGCALVSVSAAGDLQRRFVPTAPVRYEQLSLTITPEHTRDDLVLEMIGALERVVRHESDAAWLVAWNVLGRGPLVDALLDREARSDILATLEAAGPIDGVSIHSHAVRVPTHSSGESPEEPADELLSDFQRRLAERALRPQASLERCLVESSLRGGPWEQPLESLLAELDAVDVAHDARRLSLDWLAAAKEPTP